MSKRIGGLAAALCLAPVVSAAADTAAKPQPQYVLISFDGAHDNKLWDRSLKLADETGSRFTYFLSCVYLLGPEHKRLYHPPGMRAGRSNVGFAPSRDDAAERLGHVWAAYQAGHEIASHGCGHFDGKDWSKADWKAEFDQFDDILARGWEINGLDLPLESGGLLLGSTDRRYAIEAARIYRRFQAGGGPYSDDERSRDIVRRR